MNARKLFILWGLFILLGTGFSLYVSASPTNVSLGDRLYTSEVMNTAAEQQQGLSGRRNLGQQDAMLFVFEKPGLQCFWMKDMHFSIDMVWLNAEKRVIHVERNVSPQTYPNSFCPSQAASYVIETNANATKGVKVGDYADF